LKRGAGEQHFLPLNRDLNSRGFDCSNGFISFRLAMQQHLEGSQLRELCQVYGMAVHIKKSQHTEMIWKNKRTTGFRELRKSVSGNDELS
jgi:hypothetical protein